MKDKEENSKFEKLRALEADKSLNIPAYINSIDSLTEAELDAHMAKIDAEYFKKYPEAKAMIAETVKALEKCK